MIKKLLCLTLSLSLVWTSGNLAEAIAAPDIFVGPSSLPQFQLMPPGRLGRIVDYFNAPQTAEARDIGGAKLQRHETAAPSKPLVILIQDLHAHYGVQKNIAGLLEFLSKKLPDVSSLRLSEPLPLRASASSQIPFALAVEGASGPIDSSVMALFPDEKVKLAASDYLMREGELTGAEYFAIKRGLPNFLVGAENEKYYTVHRDLFRKTLADRDELVVSLKAIQSDINELPRYVFHKNKTLWEFQKQVDAYDKAEISTHEFIELLMNHVGAGYHPRPQSKSDSTPLNSNGGQGWYPAPTIDVKRDFPALVSFAANSRFGTMDQIRAATAEFLTQAQGQLSAQERKDLQLLAKNNGTTTYYLYLRDLVYQHKLFLAVPPELAQYLEYIHTAQTMGMDRVTHEAKELAFREKLSLAGKSGPAADLVQVQHDLDLLLRLADLQATEYEVRDFAPRLNQFVALTKSLLASKSSSFDEQKIRRLISSSIDFYVMALMRNKPMIDNTVALLPHSNTAVLVAGGFHTYQLTQMLREKNISYLVISPTVDKITDADHELYVKRLSGKLLTEEEILARKSLNSESEPSRLAQLWPLHRDHEGLSIGVGITTPLIVLATLFIAGHYHDLAAFQPKLAVYSHTAVWPQVQDWLRRMESHRNTVVTATAVIGGVSFFGTLKNLYKMLGPEDDLNQSAGASVRETKNSGISKSLPIIALAILLSLPVNLAAATSTFSFSVYLHNEFDGIPELIIGTGILVLIYQLAIYIRDGNRLDFATLLAKMRELPSYNVGSVNIPRRIVMSTNDYFDSPKKLKSAPSVSQRESSSEAQDKPEAKQSAQQQSSRILVITTPVYIPTYQRLFAKRDVTFVSDPLKAKAAISNQLFDLVVAADLPTMPALELAHYVRDSEKNSSASPLPMILVTNAKIKIEAKEIGIAEIFTENSILGRSQEMKHDPFFQRASKIALRTVHVQVKDLPGLSDFETDVRAVNAQGALEQILFFIKGNSPRTSTYVGKRMAEGQLLLADANRSPLSGQEELTNNSDLTLITADEAAGLESIDVGMRFDSGRYLYEIVDKDLTKKGAYKARRIDRETFEPLPEFPDLPKFPAIRIYTGQQIRNFWEKRGVPKKEDSGESDLNSQKPTLPTPERKPPLRRKPAQREQGKPKPAAEIPLVASGSNGMAAAASTAANDYAASSPATGNSSLSSVAPIIAIIGIGLGALATLGALAFAHTPSIISALHGLATGNHANYLAAGMFFTPGWFNSLRHWLNTDQESLALGRAREGAATDLESEINRALIIYYKFFPPSSTWSIRRSDGVMEDIGLELVKEGIRKGFIVGNSAGTDLKFAAGKSNADLLAARPPDARESPRFGWLAVDAALWWLTLREIISSPVTIGLAIFVAASAVILFIFWIGTSNRRPFGFTHENRIRNRILDILDEHSAETYREKGSYLRDPKLYLLPIESRNEILEILGNSVQEVDRLWDVVLHEQKVESYTITGKDRLNTIRLSVLHGSSSEPEIRKYIRARLREQAKVRMPDVPPAYTGEIQIREKPRTILTPAEPKPAEEPTVAPSLPKSDTASSGQEPGLTLKSDPNDIKWAQLRKEVLEFKSHETTDSHAMESAEKSIAKTPPANPDATPPPFEWLQNLYRHYPDQQKLKKKLPQEPFQSEYDLILKLMKINHLDTTEEELRGLFEYIVLDDTPHQALIASYVRPYGEHKKKTRKSSDSGAGGPVGDVRRSPLESPEDLHGMGGTSPLHKTSQSGITTNTEKVLGANLTWDAAMKEASLWHSRSRLPWIVKFFVDIWTERRLLRADNAYIRPGGGYVLWQAQNNQKPSDKEKDVEQWAQHARNMVEKMYGTHALLLKMYQLSIRPGERTKPSKPVVYLSPQAPPGGESYEVVDLTWEQVQNWLYLLLNENPADRKVDFVAYEFSYGANLLRGDPDSPLYREWENFVRNNLNYRLGKNGLKNARFTLAVSKPATRGPMRNRREAYLRVQNAGNSSSDQPESPTLKDIGIDTAVTIPLELRLKWIHAGSLIPSRIVTSGGERFAAKYLVVGNALPDGISATYVEDATRNLVIVTRDRIFDDSGKLMNDLAAEIIYHEYREHYWEHEIDRIDKSLHPAELTRRAHIMASRDQILAFSNGRLTPFHQLQIAKMSLEVKQQLLDQEQDRTWHENIHYIYDEKSGSFPRKVEKSERLKKVTTYELMFREALEKSLASDKAASLADLQDSKEAGHEIQLPAIKPGLRFWLGTKIYQVEYQGERLENHFWPVAEILPSNLKTSVEAPFSENLIRRALRREFIRAASANNALENAQRALRNLDKKADIQALRRAVEPAAVFPSSLLMASTDSATQMLIQLIDKVSDLVPPGKAKNPDTPYLRQMANSVINIVGRDALEIPTSEIQTWELTQYKLRALQNDLATKRSQFTDLGAGILDEILFSLKLIQNDVDHAIERRSNSPTLTGELTRENTYAAGAAKYRRESGFNPDSEQSVKAQLLLTPGYASLLNTIRFDFGPKFEQKYFWIKQIAEWFARSHGEDEHTETRLEGARAIYRATWQGARQGLTLGALIGFGVDALGFLVWLFSYPETPASPDSFITPILWAFVSPVVVGLLTGYFKGRRSGIDEHVAYNKRVLDEHQKQSEAFTAFLWNPDTRALEAVPFDDFLNRLASGRFPAAQEMREYVQDARSMKDEELNQQLLTKWNNLRSEPAQWKNLAREDMLPTFWSQDPSDLRKDLSHFFEIESNERERRLFDGPIPLERLHRFHILLAEYVRRHRTEIFPSAELTQNNPINGVIGVTGTPEMMGAFDIKPSPVIFSQANQHKGGTNEDSAFAYALDNGVQVAAVFDGMGGEKAGDEASQLMAQFVQGELESIDFLGAKEEVISQVKGILIKANKHLQVSYDDGRGCTATVTIVRPIPDNSNLEVLTFNAGDSRAYARLPDGSVHVLTIDNAKGGLILADFTHDDHAKTSGLVDALRDGTQGFLSSVEHESQLVSDYHKALFNYRSVLDNSLVASENYDIDPQVSVVIVPSGTRIFVTSDGIHDNLTEQELSKAINGTAEGVGAQALVASARLRSQSDHLRAKDDDLTAIEIVTGQRLPVNTNPSGASSTQERGSPTTIPYMDPLQIDLGPHMSLEIRSYEELFNPELTSQLNHEIGYFIVDPQDRKAVKGLRVGEEVIFGRGGSDRFQYPASVSRLHASVKRIDENVFEIVDLGSTYGTKIKTTWRAWIPVIEKELGVRLVHDYSGFTRMQRITHEEALLGFNRNTPKGGSVWLSSLAYTVVLAGLFESYLFTHAGLWLHAVLHISSGSLYSFAFGILWGLGLLGAHVYQLYKDPANKDLSLKQKIEMLFSPQILAIVFLTIVTMLFLPGLDAAHSGLVEPVIRLLTAIHYLLNAHARRTEIVSYLNRWTRAEQLAGPTTKTSVNHDALAEAGMPPTPEIDRATKDLVFGFSA